MFSLICLYFLPLVNLGDAKTAAPPYYECMRDFDVGKYTTQYERTIDSNGVIMQKKAYHPLTISVYGILNYDAFMTTGDSAYYYAVLSQYSYFANESNLVYSDNDQSVGLPYTINFKDLKAPWFSGMTQGTAVSFLLRHYALTGNKQTLELSKKIMRLMLKKESEGGTIGRTAEGGPWIEEYPKSKSKSVLNGFINGWIGLYEYCLMFPEDKNAAMIRDSCYNEMIDNMHRFDTPTWTSYSRANVPITNSYMRYQLEEFDHLYSLLGDVRLRNQMRIWSRMAMNKLDTELKFWKHPTYQYATELTGNATSDSCVFNDPKNFAAGLVAEAPYYVKRQVLKYRFSDDRYYCEVQLTGGDSVNNKKIECTANLNGNKTPVRCTYSATVITIESDTPFNELVVKFPSKKYRQKCVIVVKSYNYGVRALPLFAFMNYKRIENVTQGATCYFESAGYNLTNATVFYRYAKTGADLTKEKFKLQQTFLLKGGFFKAPETGTYEFFISYDLMHPRSAMSKLKFVTMN